MIKNTLPLFDAASVPASVSALAASLALPASAGHFDELRVNGQAEQALAPQWEQFFDHLGFDGFGDLNRRRQMLEQQLRDNGVTYNVYADEHSQQRPWALDLFPMILTPQDWAAIESGVLQRTRLLDRMMADIYGPQQLLRNALIPTALVQGQPGYLRPMQGVTPPG